MQEKTVGVIKFSLFLGKWLRYWTRPKHFGN